MSRRVLFAIHTAALMFCLSIIPQTAAASFIGFSGTGANTAALQPTIDAFRTELGDPNNGNAPGAPGGRREINWDGGGATTNTVSMGALTAFFNTRGALFQTTGSGFIQAPPGGTDPDGLSNFFDQPGYATDFGVFSPLRLFSPVGSNVTDVTFIIPGTNPTNTIPGGVPAAVSAFGAIFTDVDQVNTTTVQFFGIGNVLLNTVNVPTVPGSGGLSFVGGQFTEPSELITLVRITTGNAALGAPDGSSTDVVAMDDFLYSEPQAQAVPEPAMLLLLGVGLFALGAYRRAA